MESGSRVRRRKIVREAEGYLELGLPKHALGALERLGKPAHFDADALYLWGEALRAQEQPFEALVPLKRAVRLAPDDIRIRVALGWCYKRTGRLDLAIRSIRRAIDVEPNDALLYYNLACYLSLDGQKTRAIKHLSRALRIDPFYRTLVDAESDFDPIRDDPRFRAACESSAAS